MSETVRAGERHPEHTPFYLLLLLSYLTLGAMVLTVNTAMPAVAGEYGWTDAQGALHITCLSAGNVIASFVTGVITARLGIRRIMCLYALLIALSCALFALLPVPALFYPLMLCAGLSWGGFNTQVNTGVSLMYPGSTSRLNIGHACYGVTAVIFPLLVGFVLLHGGSWRIPVWVVAGIALLQAVLTLFTPIRVEYRKPERRGGGLAFLREGGFYLAVALLFLYVGVETAACAWLSEWMGRQNSFFARVPSETMVSLMWLTMIAGRLVFAAVGTRVKTKPLLVVLSGSILLGMIGVVFLSRDTALSIVSVAFMGLSMSGMYATAVACNVRYVSNPVAAGLIFGGGGVGSALIPLMAGAISDAAGLYSGMLALCVCLGGLLIVSLLTLLREKV